MPVLALVFACVRDGGRERILEDIRLEIKETPVIKAAGLGFIVKDHFDTRTFYLA